MNDLFDLPPEPPPLPPAPPVVELQVDPKLLPKALKKMQGLVKGNGMKTEDVTLSTEPTDIAIKMYRFKARTTLKLVSETGIKTEAGRNTKAELMPGQAEFNHALSQIVIDARTLPEKRKQIIDFIFSRNDKGFGIKEQRIKFHILNRDFVQHEKCVGCKNTGKTICGKCQGHGITPCMNCQGRRQVVCPRCRGTRKVFQHNKSVPCQYCREDGKINCPKCAGRGQNKCQACSASGAIQCQPCAGTGWLSHLAHIEVFAQILFDFDRADLPPLLVGLLEKNAAKLVEKNDIEVTLKDGWTPKEKVSISGTTEKKKDTDGEPDDTIWLNYDAICPYGPITFKLKERVVSANLFGFQAHLNDCPPFLDDLTRIGQQALIEASTGKGDVIAKVQKAARYALLKDIIIQTLWLKAPQKVHHLLSSKYTAGLRPEQFEKLIKASDLALRHITRKWRTIGLCVGMAFFTSLAAEYYLGGGRLGIKSSGFPEQVLLLIDILLLPLGMLIGTYTSKIAARWSQNNSLKGIVPDDVLARTLPKAGKTIWWALSSSVIIILSLLGAAIASHATLPTWLEAITEGLSN